MNVEIKNYPSARTLVAEICGDIDHHTAKYFRGEIDKAIRSHNPLTLILDYSQVTFMDSSGIGLVMGRYRIMSEMGGEVIVASCLYPKGLAACRYAQTHKDSHGYCPVYTREESSSGTE